MKGRIKTKFLFQYSGEDIEIYNTRLETEMNKIKDDLEAEDNYNSSPMIALPYTFIDNRVGVLLQWFVPEKPSFIIEDDSQGGVTKDGLPNSL